MFKRGHFRVPTNHKYYAVDIHIYPTSTILFTNGARSCMHNTDIITKL